MTKGQTDAVQGVFAFVGLTIGLVPLGQVLIVGHPGSLWRLVSEAGDTWSVLGPIAVIAVALVAIGLLERAKKQQRG